MRFLYVDDRTVVELVDDVCSLRRGDHCITVLNAFRTLYPWLDYWHSLLGKWHLATLFHHFVVLDDVAYLDAHGVPRSRSQEPVGILEYSNTIESFVDESKEVGLLRNFLTKAKCQRVPLAEYGDMPHVLRLVENSRLSEEERDQVVNRAKALIKEHPEYNMFSANCEHTSNFISKQGKFHSPQVSYVFINLLRYIIHIIGVLLLNSNRLSSLTDFHLCTSLPVLIQSALSLAAIDAQHPLRQEVRIRTFVVPVKCIVIFHLLGTQYFHSTTIAAAIVCKVYYAADVLFTLVFKYLLSRKQ